MDEIELRLAALELLIMERLALEPPAKLVALRDSIAVGMPDPERHGRNHEEHDIRIHALQVVDDAIRSNDGFVTGQLIKTGRQ
jgi:hypothetical protein